jgi:hypothetical protein
MPSSPLRPAQGLWLLPALRRSGRLRSFVSACTLASMFLQPLSAVSPGPAWWTTQQVLKPNTDADDFAVINQGQLKALAAKAAAEMNARFSSSIGAGKAINALLAQWHLTTTPKDDYAVATTGQLKALAAPFYERLGMDLPWDGAIEPPDDYAAANIGQAKALFSFPITTDILDSLQETHDKDGWTTLNSILAGTFTGKVTDVQRLQVLALLDALQSERLQRALALALAQDTVPQFATGLAGTKQAVQSPAGQGALGGAGIPLRGQPPPPIDQGTLVSRSTSAEIRKYSAEDHKHQSGTNGAHSEQPSTYNADTTESDANADYEKAMSDATKAGATNFRKEQPPVLDPPGLWTWNYSYTYAGPPTPVPYSGSQDTIEAALADFSAAKATAVSAGSGIKVTQEVPPTQTDFSWSFVALIPTTLNGSQDGGKTTYAAACKEHDESLASLSADPSATVEEDHPPDSESHRWKWSFDCDYPIWERAWYYVGVPWDAAPLAVLPEIIAFKALGDMKEVGSDGSLSQITPYTSLPNISDYTRSVQDLSYPPTGLHIGGYASATGLWMAWQQSEEGEDEHPMLALCTTVETWLVRTDRSEEGMKKEISRTFLKVHTISPATPGPEYAPVEPKDTTTVPPEVIVLTIPSGKLISEVVTLRGHPTGDMGVRIDEDLAPIEVEVSRPDFQKKAWVAGADNLLGVWDTHKKGNDWLDVRVKLPDGMTQSSLPSGFLKWQYEGATETIPDNTVQHRFRWPGQHGVRKISISIGSSGYKKLLFVDLPDVGGVSEHEAEAISLLLPGGLASLTRFWAWKAAARLATDDSLDLGVSKGQRNALRHAYWNALASSDPMVGQDMTLMLTTAHEWDAWDAGNQQACESTMDLWNNHQGSTVQHSILLQPNASAIWSELLQKLSSGQLWVWNADEESEHSANSKDLTIKSDRKKIFPTEEH